MSSCLEGIIYVLILLPSLYNFQFYFTVIVRANAPKCLVFFEFGGSDYCILVCKRQCGGLAHNQGVKLLGGNFQLASYALCWPWVASHNGAILSEIPAVKDKNSPQDRYDGKDIVHSVRIFSALSGNFRLNSHLEVLLLLNSLLF